MQLEPLRTAALVAAEAVAAAPVLAPPVLRALVEVHAEGAGLVQLVATWTHTPEAAVRVLARAGRRT